MNFCYIYINIYNIIDMYYFICILIFCYEFNFLRIIRIRKRFLFKRIVEMVKYFYWYYKIYM